MLGETPDEQPGDAVAKIVEQTGQAEGFVRDLLAVFKVAETVGAWPRMRWHNLGVGSDQSRLVEAPDDLVGEIHSRTGVEEDLIRHVLVIRHAGEVIGVRAWLAAGSDPWARFQALRALEISWPVPVWVDKLAAELDVRQEDRWRARNLLTAVMALVGPNEEAVRTWLATAPEEGASSPFAAMREGGLDALDRALVDSFPDRSEDDDSEDA